MSTSAIIRFCDGNKEVGAIALHYDGHPKFTRDRLLSALDDQRYNDAEEAMEAVPNILAGLYNYDIFDTEKDLDKWENSFDQFDTFDEAVEQLGGGSFHYTVHVVDGVAYY